jgi:chromosome segregation ATPase
MKEKDREINSLKLDLRGVKTQLDKSDIEIVGLNNTIESLQQTLEATNNSNTKKESSLTALLRDQLSTAQKKVRSLENDIIQLKSQVRVREDEKVEIQKELAKTSRELDQIKRDTQNSSSKLSSEVANLKKSIELKDRVIDALKNSEAVFNKNSHAVNSANAKTEDEIKKIQEKLNDAEKLNMSLVQKIELMKKEYLKQKEELRQTRQQQNNTTRNFFSTNNTSNNITLQREVEKHERITNELKKRLVTLQGDFQNSQTSIRDYEKQVSELNDTVNWLTEKNQKLKQQLEPFLLQSTTNNNNADSVNSQAVVKLQSQLYTLADHIRYLKTKLNREAYYRADLTFMKTFFLVKIDNYQRCNRADIELLSEIGIYPDYSYVYNQRGSPSRGSRKQRPTMRGAIHMVLAAIKFQNRAIAYRTEINLKQHLKARIKSRNEQDYEHAAARNSRGFRYFR